MRKFAETTLLVAVLLAVGSTVNAQVTIGIGIRIGPPPSPRVVRVTPPPPAPDFVWVEGYWYPVGRHYAWHNGYWTRSPYPGARWVAPRYEGQRYYNGYWDGDHGRVAHDHHWDNDKNRRDYDHHDNGRGGG